MRLVAARGMVYLVTSLLVALLVYFILLDLHWYLLLLAAIYWGYVLIEKNFKEKITCIGQGVLITGCDTGFGHEAALRLDALGFTVFAGCLCPEGEGALALRARGTSHLHVLHIDVTKDDNVEKAVQFVTEHTQTKGLWAVVNNAGITRRGDIELATIDLMKRVSEVNYYGMVRVTKAFLPLLRKSKGRVVNIGSVRGRIALGTHVSYNVSKWAAEAFSDTLRREMHRFGVDVVVIDPGNFGGVTGLFSETNVKYCEGDMRKCWETASPEVKQAYGPDYMEGLVTALRGHSGSSYLTVEPVLEVIIDAITDVKPRPRYLVHGSSGWLDWVCVLASLSSYLPENVMDVLIRRLEPLPSVATGEQ